MFESEELVQSIFNFLVSAISMIGCTYFFVLASTLLFQWDGVSVGGTTDVMVIGRLLEGQVPPGLKLVLTLPLQTIPMGMDISVAKRVTLVNLVIVGITLQFIYLLDPPEELRSCKDGETHNRHKIFVQDLLLTMYAFGISYFSLMPGLQITDEFNKSLRAGRLADSVLNHILKNSVAG